MLVFTDSFETYTTVELRLGNAIWSPNWFDEGKAFISIGNQEETNSVCSVDATGWFRASGIGDSINNFSNAQIDISVDNFSTTLIVGFRFRPNVAQNGYGWAMVRGNSTNQVVLRFTADLKIECYLGATLIGTSANSLTLGTTYTIEIKAFKNVSGTIEVRVNGVSVINVTGVNTSATDYTRLFVGMLGHDVSGDDPFCLDYKDVYCLSGTAPYNDFLGPNYRLHVQRARANGAQQELNTLFAASAFAAVQELDEPSIAGDGVNQLVSTFLMDELPSTVEEVVGVRHIRLAKADTYRCDHGTRMLVNVNGNDFTKSSIANHQRECFWGVDDYILAANPDSGDSWTREEVNTAEFGIRTEP